MHSNLLGSVIVPLNQKEIVIWLETVAAIEKKKYHWIYQMLVI
jgi:hypothetical protein